MIKILAYSVSKSTLGITAKIDCPHDALALQDIFRSAVADNFNQKIKLGRTWDELKKAVVHAPAFDYPGDDFFSLIWDNKKEKLYFT